ncbi:sigma-70 family RNA polymerase sigma factor [Bacillus lacus]|uniref:Sigma-70 family RNA polymerase sigma factor n=1 Tax=Metabacillus lacus TaxID=1983721 RepID=A0A7X2M156_9BACI|nr:RNA polymerase sigma factor [Metabacillus lacus]MRX73729.1 sigma-70 family RNA polymerase sigma factor [Metabacillus lacus]
MSEDYGDIEDLYERYFDDVYHYLLFFTNSKTEAEDLTHDTFVKVLKNLDNFNHKSSIKTWILSIAKHTSIDHYRKKKFISILPGALTNKEQSKYGNPQHELEHHQNWEALQKALLLLKPDYRNVVILRGLKEYSIKETSEILNWKESKVKVNYHRAIQLLRKHLQMSEKGAERFHEKESR